MQKVKSQTKNAHILTEQLLGPSSKRATGLYPLYPKIKTICIPIPPSRSQPTSSSPPPPTHSTPYPHSPYPLNLLTTPVGLATAPVPVPLGTSEQLLAVPFTLSTGTLSTLNLPHGPLIKYHAKSGRKHSWPRITPTHSVREPEGQTGLEGLVGEGGRAPDGWIEGDGREEGEEGGRRRRSWHFDSVGMKKASEQPSGWGEC